MPKRELNRLTARQVATLSKDGKHADGGGLYLHIRQRDNSRRWIFLYRHRDTGKLKEMGFGPAVGPSKAGLSLADARRKAAEARTLLFDGIDPLQAKSAAKLKMSFGEFADELVEAIAPGFKNKKHIAQWRMTLKKYAGPLRSLPLPSITTEHVLQVLQPIWSNKPETASRVRGRIERVLDAAKAKGLRTGENPARWRGHLSELLPKHSTLKTHRAALPYKEMPLFMSQLHQRTGLSARALEFTVLTAARTIETIGARWDEFDFDDQVWTIPATRMKAKKEHRVPLTDQSIEILNRLRPLAVACTDFIFPGSGKGMHLSEMAMLECLRELRPGLTVHGFRSTFRDWAGDTTHHPREVIEAALAHRIKDPAEAAYRRSDALGRRRGLMIEWERYCSQSLRLGEPSWSHALGSDRPINARHP
jgi:integrase